MSISYKLFTNHIMISTVFVIRLSSIICFLSKLSVTPNIKYNTYTYHSCNAFQRNHIFTVNNHRANIIIILLYTWCADDVRW